MAWDRAVLQRPFTFLKGQGLALRREPILKGGGEHTGGSARLPAGMAPVPPPISGDPMLRGPQLFDQGIPSIKESLVRFFWKAPNLPFYDPGSRRGKSCRLQINEDKAPLYEAGLALNLPKILRDLRFNLVQICRKPRGTIGRMVSDIVFPGDVPTPHVLNFGVGFDLADVDGPPAHRISVRIPESLP